MVVASLLVRFCGSSRIKISSGSPRSAPHAASHFHTTGKLYIFYYVLHVLSSVTVNPSGNPGNNTASLVTLHNVIRSSVFVNPSGNPGFAQPRMTLLASIHSVLSVCHYRLSDVSKCWKVSSFDHPHITSPFCT